MSMRDASKMWFYSLVPGMTLAVVTAQSDVSLIDKYFGWSSEKYSAIPQQDSPEILQLIGLRLYPHQARFAYARYDSSLGTLR